MSTLNALHRHLRKAEERRESPQPPRVGRLALLLILMLGIILGAAEMHLLPTYSGDVSGSVLFALG